MVNITAMVAGNNWNLTLEISQQSTEPIMGMDEVGVVFTNLSFQGTEI